MNHPAHISKENLGIIQTKLLYVAVSRFPEMMLKAFQQQIQQMVLQKLLSPKHLYIPSMFVDHVLIAGDIFFLTFRNGIATAYMVDEQGFPHMDKTTATGQPNSGVPFLVRRDSFIKKTYLREG
ncbi:hypothetical protein GHYDROH2_00970 [Geobacter hydrogenophilus]|uniref:Uncharacterized protein n=1 Tax=Geobacter hydrogenophilus TaxID=40983 RepID=A0A9W6FXB2_9BACT|nr:hypothetical protein GHYDROH2_00970 [Geobacter hydrogenophilus]